MTDDPKVAEAFAPAAISNFFTINDSAALLSRELTRSSDLHSVGACGGGYMLSRGVRTSVTLTADDARRRGGGGGGGGGVVARSHVWSISVDGDTNYDAKTTRMAAELLLRAAGVDGYSVTIDQTMEVPVGQGFGASAASALSTVYALASALDLKMRAADVAYFAHAADIICRTGLGTVSVTYKYGGAGVIVKPGSPGVAEVRQVSVPRGAKVLTASLAPLSKSTVLSSTAMRERVNRLGAAALETSSADLTLESLVRAGEEFADGLGLESAELSRLIRVARSRRAIGASQNMVGQAMHVILWEDDVDAMVGALRADPSKPTLSVYDFGAGPHRGTIEL